MNAMHQIEATLDALPAFEEFRIARHRRQIEVDSIAALGQVILHGDATEFSQGVVCGRFDGAVHQILPVAASASQLLNRRKNPLASRFAGTIALDADLGEGGGSDACGENVSHGAGQTIERRFQLPAALLRYQIGSGGRRSRRYPLRMICAASSDISRQRSLLERFGSPPAFKNRCRSVAERTRPAFSRFGREADKIPLGLDERILHQI